MMSPRMANTKAMLTIVKQLATYRRRGLWTGGDTLTWVALCVFKILSIPSSGSGDSASFPCRPQD